jgi:hypothetical protein
VAVVVVVDTGWVLEHPAFCCCVSQRLFTHIQRLHAVRPPSLATFARAAHACMPRGLRS